MTTAAYSIKNDPLLLAGPVCILLSLAVATLQPTPHAAYFASVALIGLCLCWKLALRGLALSLLFAAAFIFFTTTPTFWDLGIYTSLACAWVAVSLAVEQKQPSPVAISEPAAPQPLPAPPVVAAPTSLPADLEWIAQLQGELRAQQSLLERMRKLLTENELNMAAARQEVARYQEEAARAVQELSFRHAESSLCQEEATHHRQEAQKYKGLYDQLREQFEAKSTLLNDTRQKLFQAEAQLEAAFNKLKEAECEGKTPWIKNLEELLEYSEQMHEAQLEQLRRENQLLEEIIGKLLDQTDDRF